MASPSCSVSSGSPSPLQLSSSIEELSSSELGLPEQIAQETEKCKTLLFGPGCKPLFSFLNNEFSSSFEFGGFQFSCAESAYQAQKFLGRPELVRRFAPLDAKAAYELCAEKHLMKDQGWHKKRVETMNHILFAKFKQNPEVSKMLLATKDAHLIFHTQYKKMDPFWTDDSDGTGGNELGKLLMALRLKLGGSAPSSHPPKWEILPKPIYSLSPLNASDETILKEIRKLNGKMNEKAYEENTRIARKAKNLEFTRFRTNNFPYDKTLVPLSTKRFINASFVLGNKFIATQSPMPHTSEDFWTMVLEQKAPIVIMLNRVGDPGDDIYFPLTLSDRKKYGNIRLELLEAPCFKTDLTWRQTPHEEDPHAIIHRKVKIWVKGQEGYHIVNHFQYQNWLDLSAGNERAAAHFVETLNPIRAENEGLPTVIHCHAGIGRTGVLIALLEQTAMLRRGGNFALKQLVERQRSPTEGRCHSMMQVDDQYHFCYRTLRILFPERKPEVDGTSKGS
jgi:ribA/ribD-fused uncharacterized protein